MVQSVTIPSAAQTRVNISSPDSQAVGIPTGAPTSVFLGDAPATVQLVSPPVAGSAAQFQAPAAISIGGHRAVILNASGEVEYPDITIAAHGELIVGISSGAAAPAALVSILTGGELTEPGWSWSPGPVFADNNGILTQTVPAGAWIRQVAVAVTATKVIIGARPSIRL